VILEAGRHSITAVMMAAVRASHHALGPEPRIFDDPLAGALLSVAERCAFETAASQWIKSVNPSLAGSCSDSEAIVGHAMRAGIGAGVLARARYIEENLGAALARGMRQYVIIGAGLDTFAFRRPEVAGCLQVFEIDHPAMQTFKRHRLAQAGLVPPTHLYFVPADLEHESVVAALGGAPYDPASPAFFAWPGVTMYLTREAIRETLRSIAGVAPDSELVFDYLEPGAFASGASIQIRFAVRHARRLGEPMRFGVDPDGLRSELAAIGFDLIEDLGPREVQARFLERTDGFQPAEYCHLARARVRAAGSR
jgi:methyltransferase (TIGR00027 family)